jgi:hypothetical protein
LKFFIDNNLPPRLARALSALLEPDHECVHLGDRFPRKISDIEWLGILAAEGDWIVVSGDFKILRSKAEEAAWRKARLTTFFLRRGWTRSRSLSLFELTGRLILRWPEILEAASRGERGTAFEVPLTGKVRRLAGTPKT